MFVNILAVSTKFKNASGPRFNLISNFEIFLYYLSKNPNVKEIFEQNLKRESIKNCHSMPKFWKNILVGRKLAVLLFIIICKINLFNREAMSSALGKCSHRSYFQIMSRGFFFSSRTKTGFETLKLGKHQIYGQHFFQFY